MKNWRIQHREVIESFLKHLNQEDDHYILKGGTALLYCYGLDRFSEDIYLDGQGKNLVRIIESFCKKNGFPSPIIAVNTDTVTRAFINYGTEGRPLKIELSSRDKNIDSRTVTVVNNVKTYTVNTLCQHKLIAYTQRETIRDLYDLCFITRKYFDSLSSETITIFKLSLLHRGIEYFDEIVNTQTDELINNDELALQFLEMFDKFGLLVTEEEKSILNHSKHHEEI